MKLKKMTFGLILCLITPSVFAQLGTTSKLRVDPTPPSHLERYGVDYKVINHSFSGDSTILESIDLNYLEQFRLQSEDVEVVDNATGLTVVLFYRKRTKKLNTITQDD